MTIMKAVIIDDEGCRQEEDKDGWQRAGLKRRK
jgi:hypothetical protein